MAETPDSNDDRKAQLEDAKTGLPLDLMTAVPGLNPRDMSVLIVGGLGKGVTLNAGVDNGDGTATLLEQDLTVPGGLRMRFPPGASGPHSFAVTVISSDGHVRTGSLTVEPGLAPLESGLRFSIEPPVVLDDSGRVGFPVAVSFARGMGKMVGDVGLSLGGVPAGVHLTGGVREGGDDGDGPWRLKMEDLRDLSLIVPDGQGAFDVDLTVEARGQSGGRLTLTRQARVVPPGARGQEPPPGARGQESSQAAAPKPAVAEKAEPSSPPVSDWLTGNGVFTFASGHGGDLFEGGYGWSDPADSTEATMSRRSDGSGGALRLLAGGPVIDGPDPIIW
ncbi:MAG: hypothetical protein RIE87_10160 [Rhodospirillales bacterium]